jgi:hypothetical protein
MTETPCLPYPGYKDPDGYGRWDLYVKGNKKAHLAHRLAFELAYGPLADGEVVRHTCDNPPCINPFHLTSGTHRDNQADKTARGRQAKGERSGTAKLTAELVQQIRLADGRFKDIGDQFGVGASNVGMIKKGITWKHLPWPEGAAPRPLGGNRWT